MGEGGYKSKIGESRVPWKREKSYKMEAENNGSVCQR